MSRRYPVSGICEECNLPTAEKEDGEQRPHVCRFTFKGERTPWPTLSIGQAARMLNVDKGWLEGIGGNPGLRMVKLFPLGDYQGRGSCRFNTEDIERLAAQMRNSAPTAERGPSR